jgi:hypothetical protein
MKTYCPQSIKQLQLLHCSKSEYFVNAPFTFDYALPQDWLNEFANYAEHHGVSYDDIRSTTVWAYNWNGYSGPVTICSEVARIYERYLAIVRS